MRGPSCGALQASSKPSDSVDWMKKSILAIVNELGLATAPEIESVLKELTGEVKKRTMFSNLKILEEGKKTFKLLSGENSYGVEGYIPGPNMKAENDFNIKNCVVGLGLRVRDAQEIDWGLFSSRVLGKLVTDLLTLQEDLEKAYDEPKSVEMRYFDLSIRYHELYVFFFDIYGTDFLLPAEALLNECKIIIDKKEV
jgi:hypothetical protein